MANLKKILLVDDDDDLREALSEQLVMTEDFDVFEAGSGAEAIEKVKAGLYDLVILDVGLPDTDGRELCRVMRFQRLQRDTTLVQRGKPVQHLHVIISGQVPDRTSDASLLPRPCGTHRWPTPAAQSAL